MNRHWNYVIHSLICVRLGQELGTSSDLAQALASGIDWVIALAARLAG
jgi:hypothetical protein